MSGPDLTLRSISPDLAEILDTASAHDADPSRIEAFTSEWMIGELMKDEPGLTREQAIEQIRDGERAAREAGLANKTVTVTVNLAAMIRDAVTTDFVQAAADLGITLPLRRQGEDEIVDANGRDILQADPLGVGSDEEASAIADLVVLAINTLAGFAPEGGQAHG